MRTKAEWRAALLAARRSTTAGEHAAEAELLAAAAVSAADRLITSKPASSPAPGPPRVCCYVPFGREPGSIGLLDGLRAAGYVVLLPVVPTTGRPTALDWARYRGPSTLVESPYGLRQPAVAEFGPEAIADAALVLVPALAVDRVGVRLGRGAGWYDRSLPLAAPGTPLIAVIRDTEVVDDLPSERHDVLMSGVLTPHAGLRTLPLS